MDILYFLRQRLNALVQKHSLVVLRHCRSAGQAELLNTLARERRYVDLRSPVQREQALWRPAVWLERELLFCRQEGRGLFVDNLQYAPQLLALMNSLPEKGLCLAAVSQSDVLPGLAGGAENVLQLPLSLNSVPQELICFVPGDAACACWQAWSGMPRQIFARIFQGNLTAQELAGTEREEFYTAYLQNLLQYEIKEMANISDGLKFYRFLRAAAMAGAGVVNYASLAAATDITSPTAKSWLQLLAGAGIVRFLEAAAVPGRRVIKAPKFYFTDTGLAAYLLQAADINSLASGIYFEPLFATYIFNIIHESWLLAEQKSAARLFYYRDSNAKEVSMLLQHRGVLYPIEIKKDAGSQRTVVRKLRQLAKAADGTFCLGEGWLFTPGEIIKL